MMDVRQRAVVVLNHCHLDRDHGTAVADSRALGGTHN